MDLVDALGFPGEFPFTRGVQPTMYRGRLWTMRQYAGFGTAEETNERFRFLLAQGQTGLTVAFDLPTQMGHDSDASLPDGRGRTGRRGHRSLADMEILLDGDPAGQGDHVDDDQRHGLDPARSLHRGGREAGRSVRASVGGTIQNDILKEYIARGTYIFPPAASMRMITDIFAFCAPKFRAGTRSPSPATTCAKPGSTAAQELAFTLADGIAYVEAAFGPVSTSTLRDPAVLLLRRCTSFFEEVAKFRAARRLWARIMSERFGARDPRSMMLRLHAQTAGSSLTAQQLDNNVVRVTLQALAAVLGGTQSLHTNSRDEALALPTEPAVRLALRTQQIIAFESDVADTLDPLAGSYFVESLTDELEAKAAAYLEEIDEMGGAVRAIEIGFRSARSTRPPTATSKRSSAATG